MQRKRCLIEQLAVLATLLGVATVAVYAGVSVATNILGITLP